MRLPVELRRALTKPQGRVTVRAERAGVPLLAALTVELSGKRAVVLCDGPERWQALLDQLQCLLGKRVLALQPRESSPYLVVEADSQAETDRLAVLTRFQMEPGAYHVLLLTVDEYLRLQPPPASLEARTQMILQGETVDRAKLLETLGLQGYIRVPQVEEPGSYSVRGSIIDVWPGAGDYPLRIDLFGDVVDAIFEFDPIKQMNLDRVEYCLLPPARLLTLDKPQTAKLRTELTTLAGELGYPSRQLSDLLRQLSDGIRVPELELLYPGAFDALAPLDSYLGSDCTLLVDDGYRVAAAAEAFLTEELRLYQSAREMGTLVLPPHRLYRGLSPDRGLEPEALSRLLSHDLGASMPVLDFRSLNVETPGGGQEQLVDGGMDAFVFAVEEGAGKAGAAAAAVRAELAAGTDVLLLCENLQGMERARRILGSHGLGAVSHEEDLTPRTLLSADLAKNRVQLFLGELDASLVARSWGLLLLAEGALFTRHVRAKKRQERSPGEAMRLLSSLVEGDLVVHDQYGVGRFMGLERRTAGGIDASFLALEYRNGDRLFLPVYQADRIHKYIGGETAPNLDRLGAGTNWEKKKEKARDAARTLAVDLLKIYAARKTLAGHAFSGSDEYFEEFEASFPYEETADQKKAIDDVLGDMEKPEPMDRLLCGDVGFGKTEVAVRAAFKAVLDGKQVAVLVPTTILAQQHQQTFLERLKGYPVRVESLSRFKSAAEQKKVLQALEQGRVDVVIGTHALVKRSIAFKALGLLVIDEEHKFGVNHKEKLRDQYPTVDVLSMTATPIPRTLNMALAGIRDISVITSPPTGRHAIETRVIRWDARTIGDAIRKELERGGQIFFLHNNVKEIENLAEKLHDEVPELKIGIAHGQMDEGELEKAMLDFADGRFDLLLCTTIIESGLDLPRVNTLIVNNAHCFGLAQLYQIRGRVGRGSRKAHAYFIVPSPHSMTDDARKRLAALTRYTALGSGFTVASMDMEIRGAGEMLGAQQSGNISAIGYDLFIQMVEEEVGKLKSPEQQVERPEPEIHVPIPVSIPEDYVEDKNTRIMLYRRIASATDLDDLVAISQELEARFGALPKHAVNFLGVVRLKQLCRQARIASLDVVPPWVRLDLSGADPELAGRAAGLISKPPCPLKLAPEGILELKPVAGASPLVSAREALSLLGLDFGWERCFPERG